MRNCVLRLKVIRAMQDSKRWGRGVRRTGVDRRIKWDSQGPWKGGSWANTWRGRELGRWVQGNEPSGLKERVEQRPWGMFEKRNGSQWGWSRAVRRRRWVESKTAGWQLGCAAREIHLRRVSVLVVLLQYIYLLCLHSMWNISSQDQGSNTQPLHWKCNIPATGPPG